MPSLSVRSFSEMLNKPAYEQVKILHEQKYPKSSPSAFKIPYYQKSLNAIRTFYKGNNKESILKSFIRDIEISVKQDSKRKHNIRVLTSFENGEQFDRELKIKTNKKFNLSIGNVDLRLNFDIIAKESKIEKMILYNFRNAEIDEELARITLEISYYILESNGYKIAFKNLEFVDLFNGKLYSFKRVRKNTINLMRSNIDIIETLWSKL